MIDPTALRETANNLGRAAGELTQQAFEAGGDLQQLQKDVATLRAATDICRRTARRMEARRAQQDEAAPLCLGCRHRKDRPGEGIECDLAMDTREAATKRKCQKYDPE